MESPALHRFDRSRDTHPGGGARAFHSAFLLALLLQLERTRERLYALTSAQAVRQYRRKHAVIRESPSLRFLRHAGSARTADRAYARRARLHGRSGGEADVLPAIS